MRADVDQVQIEVAGRAHTGWQRYDLDSHLQVPADAWSVELASSSIVVPAEVKPGAAVQVRVGGELVMDGAIDNVSHLVGRNGQRLMLAGRDRAGVLLDCSAPMFTATLMSLQTVVEKIVKPLGVTRVRIDATRPITRERVNTEPGDTAWDMLRRAAEANGLFPWFEPDGTLVVGGPRYDSAPVATLVVNSQGTTNVLDLDEHRSGDERYSELTVLGQSSGNSHKAGQNNVRAVLRDPSVTVYRPRVVVDHEATTQGIAAARGSKLMSDARVKAYELRALVQGHRTAAGALWRAGQRLRVVSEPHNLDGIYFLIGRKFTADKVRGQLTQLVMKEDGAWALYAHPSLRKHRRGKNSVPLRVIDASTGAPP